MHNSCTETYTYLILGTYTKTWFWLYDRCQGRHVSNTYKIYHYISLVGIKIALDVREIVRSTFNEKVQVDVCYQTFFIISFFCWLLNLYNEIVQFLFNARQDCFFIVFCLQPNVQHHFHQSKKSLCILFSLESLLQSLPPVLGQIVNPISTRGADYSNHSNTSPGFSDLAMALLKCCCADG